MNLDYSQDTSSSITYTGNLTRENGAVFLSGAQGERFLEGQRIWDGYINHWEGKRVHARSLPQRDYESGDPIVLVWPAEGMPAEPYVELYYNERLIKYFASLLGHNAININGGIYNFSHKLNENEIMMPEEFFYRPALGEFAPSPVTGMFDVPEDGPAYYDKFGRNFMRTIHVLRITGMDTDHLSNIYNRELEVIHHTPPKPKKPEKYADFSIWTRSCTTIIRDGLKAYGYPRIKGIFPRELFISAGYELMRDPQLTIQIFKRPQLRVPEAPPSRMSPLLNPKNYFRLWRLKHKYVVS